MGSSSASRSVARYPLDSSSRKVIFREEASLPSFYSELYLVICGGYHRHLSAPDIGVPILWAQGR